MIFSRGHVEGTNILFKKPAWRSQGGNGREPLDRRKAKKSNSLIRGRHKESSRKVLKSTSTGRRVRTETFSAYLIYENATRQWSQMQIMNCQKPRLKSLQIEDLIKQIRNGTLPIWYLMLGPERRSSANAGNDTKSK